MGPDGTAVPSVGGFLGRVPPRRERRDCQWEPAGFIEKVVVYDAIERGEC